MTAYHHFRAKHARALQVSELPAMTSVTAAMFALRACDATRVSTPAPCCDTKGRDTKWEVDSKAEVDGS